MTEQKTHTEELEELEDRIEQLEGRPVGTEHEDHEHDDPKHHESGDIRPDLDDQTITPPG